MARRITPEPRTDKAGVTRFRVRFRHDGTATSRTFEDIRSANLFIDLLYSDGPAGALETLGDWQDAGADAMSVTEWLTEHLADKSGIQPDTRATYERYIARDFAQWSKLPVAALTQSRVSRWVNAEHEGGASAKTIANKHGFLASAMKGALHAGAITVDPCANTRLPRDEVEDMVFLTHEEYARFLDYFTPHWQPMIAAMFATGLRFGELTALQVRDLALEDGSLSVVRAWKRGRVLGPPKSRRSRRTISLAPETVDTLRPLIEGRAAEAWVFVNQQGGPVRHATFMENVWNPAVRLANGEPAAAGKRVGRRRNAAGEEIVPAVVPLGKRPTPHDARHTCASWLLGAGVPINWVQAHLGHESITTTEDRYGHVMPAARAAVAGALSGALAGAHPQVEG